MRSNEYKKKEDRLFAADRWYSGASYAAASCIQTIRTYFGLGDGLGLPSIEPLPKRGT